jgi:SOS regulatory protein LexA
VKALGQGLGFGKHGESSTHNCFSEGFPLTVYVCTLYPKYTVLSHSDTTYWTAIREFSTRRRRMPSYGEIMELAGFRSRHAVTRLVQRLVAEGVVTKDPQGKLIPARHNGEVPLLGLVEAGWPSPAEEELLDTMSLDQYLIGNREATYLLKVKGDSMLDAGIQPGDLVIVERTNAPRVGDIVIAEVDGEWTMKYLRKRGEQLYLTPANKKYRPIVPKEELKVVAVVKAVVRKY